MQNLTDENEYAKVQDRQRGASAASTLFKVIAATTVIAAVVLFSPIASSIPFIATFAASLVTGGALTTAGMLTAGGLAVAGLFSTYKAVQMSQTAGMAEQELDARRSAIHLSRANELEKARDANLVAAGSMPTKWRETVQAERLEKGLAEGRTA